jgi:hypothetical protein
MRAERILSRWLEPLTDFMHAKRQRALSDVVGALMKGRLLWVTALGRALPGPAKFKQAHRRPGGLDVCEQHRSRADREHSDVGACADHLRPSTWPKANWRRAVQRGFLEHLQQVLPAGRQIVIVTDAGFGRSWFDDVTACGLHFVGRLTRNNTLRPRDAAQALRVHDLFAVARIKPRSVGRCMVTRDRLIEATVVVQRMKNKSRHRSKFRTRGLNPSSALHECYKRRAHEPWVLACSAHELNASCISRIYASRMRCEQAFRDGKNLRFGLGLGHVSVRQTERLHVLLLLVAVVPQNVVRREI